MQIDVKEVIKRVEVRLAEIGMSKAEFYRKSGISSASFSKWNTGVNSPSMKKLKNVSDCLGVSLDYLLTGEQKEKPASEEAGFHPTLEDWINAIDRMSREEMRAVMSRVMERYAGEDK